MIALTARTFLRQKEARAKNRSLSGFVRQEVAPTPALVERARLPAPTPARPQPRPGDQEQAGLFSRIFKETVGGVETLHSKSPLAEYLARHSALGFTEPGLKRWLATWAKLGGIALR
jgi:hypothetical protein